MFRSRDVIPVEREGDPAAEVARARVLLVDDRPGNLVALEAVLGTLAHELVSVRSGAEALLRLERDDFAVVLLDVQMPQMDGYETALRMKEIRRDGAARVPIIFLTAIDTDPSRVSTLYAHGGVDFVQKPLDPVVLRSKVSVFVELFRARQEVAAEREAARRRAAAGEARLQGLAGLALVLSHARTRGQVTEVVIEHGMQLARADTCTLYLLDPSGAALDLVGERGVGPEIVRRIRRITEASVNARILAATRTGEALWVESAAEYAAIFPELARAKTREPRANAFWSVPLTVEGRAIGLLGMGFYEARRFPPEERSFVETFTKLCAQGLQRALLLEREDWTRRWLTTTLRSIADAVIATDVEGRVTFMNPVAERSTGWSEEEARTQPLERVLSVVSDAGDALESLAARLLREGVLGGLAEQVVLRSRGGEETPIDASVAPIRDQGGKLLGVVVVFRDVAREKRELIRRDFLAAAGEALVSSLDYRATLATVARLAVPRLADWCAVDIVEPGKGAPHALATAHLDGELVRLAPESGSESSSDVDEGVSRVVRTGRSELHAPIPAGLIEAGRGEEELRVVRELRLTSAMIVPLCAHGRTLGALTFAYAESRHHHAEVDLAFAEDFARRAAMAIENARALKDAEAARAAETALRGAAEIASRAKDEFLATVSHELRTPLNAILGWTIMLRNRNRSPENERALAIVERNARAQAKLIDDILDVSRIIGGKLSLNLGPTEVAGAIEASVETVTPAADAKGVKISVMIGAGDLAITADAARLQQIVWNLLSNAVKFTSRGGEVTVRAYREGPNVCVSVSDSGEGIRADALLDVFEAFHQADASTTRRHGGLGLGLAIVKQLVVAHGGTVSARSEGEGKGATFLVRLPSRPAVSALRRPSFDASTREDLPAVVGTGEARLDGLRLLVVDDEEDARALVGEALSDFGAVVDLAGSAWEALAQFDRDRPDVIVSDVGMPVMDGYSFIQRIRALPVERGGRTPALALTAYARPEDEKRALAAGFQRHVTKPVEAPLRLPEGRGTLSER